jgi:hypothetical protein
MRKLQAVVLLAALLALPACAKKTKTVDLGLKRITLDLAFKDQSKAAKPTVAQVLGLQEPFAAPVQILTELSQPTRIASVLNLPLFACATAPSGARPEIPVSGVASNPPVPGVYTQHNKGTFALDGPLKLKGEFPVLSAMEIANVTDETTPDVTGGGTVRTITYDVIERSNIVATTTRYQSIVRSGSQRVGTTSFGPVSNELDLVWAETVIGADKQTFNPSTPVTIMQYNGEGSTWNSVGVDDSTGTTMAVSGTITKREPIDVCGKVIDTFRVESTERVVNAITSYTSQTNDGKPNVYNVATQFGGLMVSRHTDTTTSVLTTGGTETLVVDNTAVVDSVTPRKK